MAEQKEAKEPPRSVHPVVQVLVALVLLAAGAAIMLVSLVDDSVPRGLQGWGLFCGFVLACCSVPVTLGREW